MTISYDRMRRCLHILACPSQSRLDLSCLPYLGVDKARLYPVGAASALVPDKWRPSMNNTIDALPHSEQGLGHELYLYM